ncbi:MAG: PilT/PilU family type 4a pilus ATPase [Candidatus Competibacter denitrificans]|jgi:twitching motility protein PilU|uniref:Twitching motility protein n=1 Tax=Candidatus Competibacter denitrificans Run_A_D11 TaxID=1400863 RepID=W6MB03_9GAMM|nr:PilT/PilU family type 4a pilus ATPase [Candidatus Competibacter denitrificans]CDI03215.1 twitching motility protein [Candidatus Competibacter denitrificans Run_A_D11]HAS87258.1 type IV pilus twitching motility protein PilT [Candidatus Competibacteraceae bacterium]HRC70013.1 PilT/PilU family type 4a pilus ATPase [Candidatus Competibacter denitrificans]
MEQKLEGTLNDSEKATQYLYELTLKLLEMKGSDIFITAGSPPALKINQDIRRVSGQNLTPQQAGLLVRSVMNDRQAREFDDRHEINFSLNFPDVARFRVSAFTQRGSAGMVLRLIQQQIPTIDDLNLPSILRDIAMAKRGLVIFLGGTGSGKTTSMAALIDHRNSQAREHIITVEDPIEFFHRHKQCLVDQREVGVDTESYEIALKNTLRQAPNVILIGEVRDRETMQSVINFAETGHLCLTTLHANNTDQAFDRILNFFPEERHQQVLMDLSFNIKAFISQRLLPRQDRSGLVPAVEILLNTPLMAELIFQGRIKEIKPVMARSGEQGIITFDMALFDLYESKLISYETAIRHADSANNLRLKIKLESKRPPPPAITAQLNIDAAAKR